MPKSTENTVFVRFVPTPTHKLRRQQLENIFSEIGPVKKTSWICSAENESKGYGFVKYLSSDDALAASSSLNNKKLEVEGVEYNILVEVASLDQRNVEKKPKDHDSDVPFQVVPSQKSTDDAPNGDLKKKCRIILRNLSFYAKEHHIRSVLEKYGEIVDLHLPHVKSNLHVGFCFVTFSCPEAAQRAVDTKCLDIQNRTVSLDWCLPKAVHQQVKHSDKVEDTTESAQGGFPLNDQGKNHVDDHGEDEAEEISPQAHEPSDSAVKEERTIFLRNLPFDTSRKELFELFAKFGYIESIYLVKDKVTEMPKGTAFITYKRAKSAKLAITMASQPPTAKDENLVPSQTSLTKAVPENISEISDFSLVIKGRRILVDYAVDRETAETFDSKELNSHAADRRNMYLQSEGRVESTPTELGSDKANTWDTIPEQDQKKRQTALKDKTTKLQSPIFFINPNRLSIRNLAKHVDEIQLRNLCEEATKKGLLSGLVSVNDQIAHLRAKGELSTREILTMIQGSSKTKESFLPPWDETRTTKEYIPSVFLDREYSDHAPMKKGNSRGFGFVEFTHHIHALACLRELNNNPTYSREYVSGGKTAVDLKRKAQKLNSKGPKFTETRIPRLIVDFTVENRIKAKKQMDRRLQQKVNNANQRKHSTTQSTDNEHDSKRRSRGASQRAKKRQKI